MRWLPAGVVALNAIAPGHAQDAPPAPAPAFRAADGALGIDAAAFRVALSDLDGDGFPEAIVHEQRAGRAGGRLRLYHNVADASAPGGRAFREVADAWGLRARTGDAPESESVFCVFGDLNDDGHVDAVRVAYNNPAGQGQQPDTGERTTVLLGGPGPRFTPLPACGLQADGPVTTCSAVLLDYDRDGALDCFTGNWYVHYGQGLGAHPDRLWRGDGTGRFVDVTAAAGLLTTPTVGDADSSRPTYAVAHADVDDDGWPDLLAASYGRQWNRAWHNRGDGTFVDVALAWGIDGDADRTGTYPAWAREHPRLKDLTDEPPFRANGNTFGLVPHDLDRDGMLDLVSVEITHAWAGPSSDRSAVLWNRGATSGVHRFRRDPEALARPHTVEPNWNQGDVGAAVADLDADGWPEICVASTAYPDEQRLRCFRRAGADAPFGDVATIWGLDLRDCNQLSIGDVNGDGWLDVLAVAGQTRWNGRAAPSAALFLATPRAVAHWVALTLEGNAGRGSVTPHRRANRSAIGARVWVRAGGITHVREVTSATGHFGQQGPRRLHVGLGAATRVTEIRVRWPDRAGTVQTWRDFAADRHYRLLQRAE